MSELLDQAMTLTCIADDQRLVFIEGDRKEAIKMKPQNTHFRSTKTTSHSAKAKNQQHQDDRFRILVAGLFAFLLPTLTLATTPADGSNHPSACAKFERQQRPPGLVEELMASGQEAPCALLYAGLIQRERGQTELASQTLKRAHGLFPNHFATAFELAISLSWIQKFDESLAAFRQAGELAPSSTDVHLGVARVLSWQGDLSASEQLYRELLQDEPQSLDALNGLAFVERSRLKLSAARAIYETVLKLQPDNREAAEGLQTLSTIQRARIEVSRGREVVTNQPGRQATAVRLNLRLRPRASLNISYLSDSFELQDPLVAQGADETVLQENLTLSTTWGLGRQGTAGATISSRRSATDSRSQLFYGLSYSHPVAGGALFGGLRSGSGPFAATVSNLGYSRAFGDRLEAVGQLFLSNSDSGSGQALAVSLRYRLPGRLSAQLSSAIGRDPNASFSDLGLSLSWEVSPKLHLVAGTREHQTLTSTLSTRLGLRIDL